MTFRVGQKVVCINAPVYSLHPSRYKELPKQGVVYTVRGYRSSKSILLFEIVSGFGDDGRGEAGFYASRFRPVIERKTDITVFTEILRKTNIGVDA